MSLLSLLSFQIDVTLKPRWGHSITAYSLDDNTTKVVMFGGSSDPRKGTSLLKLSKLSLTVILLFCKYMNQLQ